MKKIKAILLSTISALGLASCSFQDAWTAVKDGTTGAFEKVKDVFVKDKGEENNEDKPKPCSHVDANMDHKCDLCEEAMGEHKDLDGDGKCDYCSANIPSVVSVTIEEGERSVGVGQSIKLVAKVQAVGGASKSVTWKVDDSSKASIDSTGKLVGLQAGSVLVTATSSVDPTKSASVTVEVTEPGWSQASMDMMAEKLHGVTLPFFGASWSQPEYDEEDYVVSTSSKEGNLNEIKSLFEAAGFTVEETTFALTDTVSVDGLLASIDVGDTGYVEVQVADLNSYQRGAGVMVIAYYGEFVTWPAEMIAEFIGEHTEETVPQPEGKVTSAVLKETTSYDYVSIQMQSNAENYVQALTQAGWECEYYDDYECFDCFSPEGYLEVIVYPFGSNSLQMKIFLADPPAAEFPSEAVVEFVGEHSTDEIPTPEGTGFELGYTKYGDLYVDITNGDLSAYVQALTELGYVCEDLLDTEGYVDCVSPTSTLEIVLFDLTPYGYPEGSFEFQLMLIEPPAPEFPAEDVAEFVGDYTTDTVPAAEGTAFETFTSQGSFIINVTGGTWVSYSETLAQAEYTIHEAFGDGMYVATSPSGALDITVFEEEGMIQIQVAKVVAPTLTAFPSDNVDAFLSGATPETLPVPTAGGFDDKGVITSSSSYYEVIVRYADVFAYAKALQDAGWSINTSYYSYYRMIQAFSPLGSITLQLWDNGVSFDLDAYIDGEAYFEWPTAKVAAMCEGNTEVEIPAAEGSGFSVTKNDGSSFYFGVIKVAGADVEDYLAVLESNGFEYYYDTDYSCYTAHKGDLALDLYGGADGAALSIQAYGYVAPAAEWPTDEIVTFLGDSITETVLAPATATSFVGQAGEGYYQVTVNGGDLAEYLTALETANYVIDSSMYDAYLDYYGYGIYFITSPEGQFTLQIADLSNYVILVVPVPTEWTEDEVQLMEELIGEPLPFFGGISYWYEYYEALEGSIDDESYLNGIFEALVNDGWTGGYDESEYEYIYTKESTVNPGNVLKAEIYGYFGSYYIDVSVEEPAPAPITEWPAETISEALGEKAQTAVPECEGTEYEISLYTDGCDIYVYGGDYDSYVQVIEQAGFTFVETRGTYYHDYISADGTVLLTICNGYSNGIDIMAFAQEPQEPGVEFPSEQVNADLDLVYGLSLGSTPLPEGTDFTYNLVNGMYPTVTVTGGDKAAYIQALLEAGFERDDAASTDYSCDAYKNGTIEVYIYAENDGIYDVEFGAIYEPMGW